MTSENFCICFPNDAHLPLVINNEPEDIKKGIIKVLL
jgi:beta-galactosidase beta subunit